VTAKLSRGHLARVYQVGRAGGRHLKWALSPVAPLSPGGGRARVGRYGEFRWGLERHFLRRRVTVGIVFLQFEQAAARVRNPLVDSLQQSLDGVKAVNALKGLEPARALTALDVLLYLLDQRGLQFERVHEPRDEVLFDRLDEPG